MEEREPGGTELESFIRKLESLKQEAETILGSLGSDTRQGQTPAGILEEIVQKYQDQAGVVSALKHVAPPDFGVSKLIPVLAEFPVLEFWIYKKAGLKRQAAFPPLPDRTLSDRLLKWFRWIRRKWRIYRSPYRTMPLDQLVEEQINKLSALIELLNKTKQRTDNLYEELYSRHIEMQEDAQKARSNITRINEYVKRLNEVNEEFQHLHIDPHSEEGLKVGTLITYLRKYAGPITEFRDDCNHTVKWLFEVQNSYKLFEDMISNYSRMINALRRRTSNMQAYINDFTNIIARLKEGQEVSRELLQGMVALMSGVYASANCIEDGVREIIGTYGSLETLELPAYVNQILSGPLSDVLEANRLLQGEALPILEKTART